MSPVQENNIDLMAVLEDLGHRSTAPRRKVISAIGKKQNGFGIEEIIAELPGTGRATVYRTIKLLLQANVICQLALPDVTPKYVISRLEHHHHTICVSCGTVGEFRDVTVERLLKTIGGEISGEILGHRIEFYITCRNCINHQT